MPHLVMAEYVDLWADVSGRNIADVMVDGDLRAVAAFSASPPASSRATLMTRRRIGMFDHRNGGCGTCTYKIEAVHVDVQPIISTQKAKR